MSILIEYFFDNIEYFSKLLGANPEVIIWNTRLFVGLLIQKEAIDVPAQRA